MPPPNVSPGAPNRAFAEKNDSGNDSDSDAQRGRTRIRGTRRHCKKRPLSAGYGVMDDASNKKPRSNRGVIPHLPPPTPSTGGERSRSPSHSPVRKALNNASCAEPPLRISGAGVRREENELVYNLVAKLTSAAEPRIPVAFRERLCQVDDPSFYPTHLFSDSKDLDSRDVFWRRSSRIIQTARECYDYQKDEGAWSQVARQIINTALNHSDDDEPRHNDERTWELAEIQTQNLNPRYLPTHSSISYAKKSDLALNFCAENPHLAPIYQAAKQSEVPLSHMYDDYTMTVPIAMPLEIKSAGGNQEQAKLQISVFSAASLIFLAATGKQNDTADQNEYGPVLGWTSLGHVWSLYISWMDSSGSIHVHDIPLSRAAGTKNYLALFSLIGMLRAALEWLKTDYLPWYASIVCSRLRERGYELVPTFPRKADAPSVVHVTSESTTGC